MYMLTERPVSMQLLTKPCKPRVNTIPLQHTGAEHTADQHIANATARGQQDFQFALLPKLLHTETSRTASSSVILGSYKVLVKMFIILKTDIIVLKKTRRE